MESNLQIPPPVTGPHLVKHPIISITVLIHLLWCVLKMLPEGQIPN